MDEGMTDLAFVDAQLASTETAAPAGAATSEGGNDGKPTTDAGASSASATDATGSGDSDNGAGNEPPAGESAAADDGAAKGDEGKEDDEISDLIEDLSVTALNKKLEANPALKTALDADPATRNLVFSAIRRSAKLDQFEQIFTNPETARFTLDTANEMVEFDRLFNSADAKDAQAFIEALHYNSLEKDDQGNLRTDANGRPISTGAYERIMGTYRQHMWSDMERIAVGTNDDELKAAIALIKERIEGVQSSTPAQASSNGGPAELPDDVKIKLRELDEFKRKERESQATSQTNFAKEVNTEVASRLSDEVKKLVANITKRGNIALSDYELQNVVRDSVETVRKNLKGNPAYSNMVGTLMKSGDKTKVINHVVASAKQSLPRIVAAHISTATKGKVTTAQARTQKIDSQIGRKEPETTGGVTKSQSLPDIKQVLAEATKKKGKPLTELEEVDLYLANSGQ